MGVNKDIQALLRSNLFRGDGFIQAVALKGVKYPLSLLYTAWHSWSPL